MSKCDIKGSAKAYNDGLDAFKKAFKYTGGKTTESIKLALQEINDKNPGFDFDVKSFVNPLISQLKDKKIIPANYSFRQVKDSGSGLSKKIEKATEKMSELKPEQRKEFARQIFNTLNKNGDITNDEVKNFYSEAVGVPSMNEKIGEQITKLSKALTEEKDVDGRIEKQIRDMQSDKDANGGKLTEEQDKKYTEVFSELSEQRKKAKNDAMREASDFAYMLAEKRYWLHQLSDYMPLNLMNPNSLEKNISGAIVDGVIRTMGNTLASPVSYVVSQFTKINSNPILSRVKGGMKGNFKEKSGAAWKYGMTDFNNELPRANHISAANRFKKAMDETGFNKFKGMLSSILKLHPDLISKGLTVPDAIAYEMVKSAEIMRMAEAKGLKGAELEAFMMKPDEKTEEVAHGLAKEATFRQDLPEWMSPIKKISSYDPHERAKALIDAGWSPLSAKIVTGLRAIVQKSAVPFIKTPINILRTSSKVLLPEYAFGEMMLKAKKETDPVEKQRLIIEAGTRYAAGMFVRHVALQLISQGLISAGYGDEDKKTKDVVEQELGGPNRVNYSALVRGLSFQDMKKRKGDTYVDLNSLGALGITMAVYAHAYNKFGKEDIENRTSYSKNISNAVSVPWDLAWASLSSSLDFTFFTGINQLQGALMNKEGYESKQLATQYIANLFTGVVPSTVQKLSTQYSPEVKKQFDKDLSFSENLRNVLGYRFAFQSKELQNKYFSLSKKDGGAEKKKEYVLFDNYLGRVLESEFDFAKITKSEPDGPIQRLHEAMRDVPKENRDDLFPAAINDEISVPARKNNRKSSVKVKLTPEQYDYVREQASVYRMMLATPFIMSEDFKKATPETRAKVLQVYYNQGLEMAKKNLKSKYPDIMTQKIEGELETRDIKKIVSRHKAK